MKDGKLFCKFAAYLQNNCFDETPIESIIQSYRVSCTTVNIYSQSIALKKLSWPNPLGKKESDIETKTSFMSENCKIMVNTTK